MQILSYTLDLGLTTFFFKSIFFMRMQIRGCSMHFGSTKLNHLNIIITPDGVLIEIPWEFYFYFSIFLSLFK